MPQLFVFIIALLFARVSQASDVHHYAKEGRLNDLKQLLESSAEQLNALDEHGRTALHYAAWSGHKDVVEYLVAKGADLEIADRGKGWTPIFFSVLSHKQHITPILLNAGANLERRDKRGRTPIFELRTESEIEFNRQLGAKLDIVDKGGDTPLSFSIERGAVECAKYYLEAGLSFHGVDHNGKPLKNAATARNMELVRLLLDKGADPNQAVGEAMYQPDTVMISLFLSRGAKLQNGGRAFVDKIVRLQYDTPEQYGFYFRQYDIDAAYIGEEGRTLLHEAVVETNVPLVHYLIKVGANVNARDSFGCIPLHYLSTTLPGRMYCGNSFDEWYSKVKLYDPATRSTKDTTLSRTEAMDTMTLRIARMLLDAGADPNVAGYRNEIPIERASSGWNKQAIMLLAERGSDIGSIWGHGFASSFIWGKLGDNSLLEFFLKKGLNANIPSLLEESIRYGRKRAAQLLVQYGAVATQEQLDEIAGMQADSDRD